MVAVDSQQNIIVAAISESDGSYRIGRVPAFSSAIGIVNPSFSERAAKAGPSETSRRSPQFGSGIDTARVSPVRSDSSTMHARSIRGGEGELRWASAIDAGDAQTIADSARHVLWRAIDNDNAVAALALCISGYQHIPTSAKDRYRLCALCAHSYLNPLQLNVGG